MVAWTRRSVFALCLLSRQNSVEIRPRECVVLHRVVYGSLHVAASLCFSCENPEVLSSYHSAIGTTPIPEELFCWDFFEMYYQMTGSSAKLDQ